MDLVSPTRRDLIAGLVSQVSRRLLDLRTGRVTQARVAKVTGISRDTLRRIDNGQAPTLEQLLLLCDAFEVSPATLLGYGRSATLPAGESAKRFEESSDRLAPSLALNPVVGTLAVGEQQTPCRHDGTEWVFVVNGVVGLRYGRSPAVMQLEPQIPYEFDAVDVHALSNLGTEPAMVLRRASADGHREHGRN